MLVATCDGTLVRQWSLRGLRTPPAELGAAFYAAHQTHRGSWWVEEQMTDAQLYDQAFYDELWLGGLNAARLLMPLVAEPLGVSSLVDVGCGGGAYLSVAKDLGVTRLVGLDGPASRLGKSHFDEFELIVVDLEDPVGIDETFDLAMSIEVAEHLRGERASTFVSSLVSLSDLVLFSAAFPGQGGTGHINEQWPSYWAALFAVHGYRPLEVCRSRFWTDSSVPLVLRMNVLLYVAEERFQELAATFPEPAMLDVVHPQLHSVVPPSLVARIRDRVGRRRR